MKLLSLHLRARGAALPSVVLGVAALTGWWVAVVGAVALLGSTLGGADASLERTTAVPWRWWRLTHVLVASVLLAPTGATGVGLLGLALVAAVFLGSERAWIPVVAYAVPALTTELPLWPAPEVAAVVWVVGAVLYSRPFSIT
ncbi:hypothetical protein [Allokutzneria sp. NRRL B-24872]|uniref:hypothetical protein n=1 Tax=Allokutzneria sp. NRRL B-24872 TaxID=1137961 RepID=UPI000A3BC861|nr:hypothetical protein [Allokutzneria sp. NRRL B-24872]